MRTGEDFPDGDGVEADGEADGKEVQFVSNEWVSICK